MIDRGNDTHCHFFGKEVQLFTRNEGDTIIIIVLHIMQQCDNNGFIRHCQNPIKGAGSCSMVRVNYLQEVLGDHVGWDLVVIFVKTLNTSLSSCKVRPKRVSNREIACVVLNVNY